MPFTDQFCVCVQIDVSSNRIDQAASLELIAAMKGKSMASIGMAQCQLGVEGAKAMAELVSVTGSLTTLILWDNKIGPDGAKVIAESLSINGSLTECDLRKNKLGIEGWTIIFNALRDSPTSKITKWDLTNESLGAEIAKPLAEYISVTGSLTKLWLSGNQLNESAKTALRTAARPALKLHF